MIYVYMAGRAGNQLFRYSAARKISKETQRKIIVNFNPVYKSGFKNDLLTLGIDNFEIDDGKIYRKKSSLIQKLLVLIYRLIYKLFIKHPAKLFKLQCKLIKFYSCFGIYFSDLKRVDFSVDRKKKFIILLGCFESPTLLDDVEEVYNEISRKGVSENNKAFFGEILSSNSICITIRRGDFLQYKEHDVCGKDFYYKAIERMKSLVENPVFFIFSDDIEWCRENIKIPGFKVYYETGDDDVREKLTMMMSCKNFIVSNSSFSWWAQYLSQNKNKIVIGPEKMYELDIDSELILDTWVNV